ncbi:winged helix-turn-helix domain-containing protein [Indioceanicola profundi]|uniref:winged helix-turn-helix domain-containing protein n=1 Tax=Indioceanicola profundi TaxID=2220096 RepID=UPI000E6AD295|nr:winged helix-turn-helix domain-containing protein [Indioceanicola profundi]
MHQVAKLADAGADQRRSGVPRLERMLVVTEDSGTRDMIIDHLTCHQCVALGSKPAEVTRCLQQQPFSLVVLDVRHRPLDGFDMLQSIRARSDVPVILFAERDQEEIDRILAFELGADDLIGEPLNVRELLARARAILRRQEMGRRSTIGPVRGSYRFAGWDLRCSTRVLTDPAGAIVPLSRKEYALLLALLEAPRRPLSRSQLMRATGSHEDAFDRSVDVQVLRLRRKIEADPSSPRLIRTERGVGYMLDVPVETLF